MERIFLGNDKPLLHLTADYLIDRFYKQNRLDMHNVILTFQEQRAANRLEEILAERAEQIDPAWYPPEFLTIGTLPEKLYELKHDLANELTQCFAWLTAIDQLNGENPDLLRRLITSLPNRSELEPRLALGRMFAKLHRELAAETLDFIRVAQLCRQLKIESESLRWEALDKLQKKYLAKLDSLQIWDVQSARLFALEKPEEFAPKQSQFQKDGTTILLVGVADMNLAQKEILRHFHPFVTPLIFAPKNWTDRFDEFGCLVPHAWQDAQIELKDEQIHIVEAMNNQAEEVMRCLTDLKGNYAPSEIIVGVPDKQVIPFIERQFEQANIQTRIVAGTSIRQTPVYRFLEMLLPFLEKPSFSSFAALVRHPDVETLLRNKLPNAAPIISELDRYYMEHLPADRETVERSELFKAVWQQLESLLYSQNLNVVLREIFPTPVEDNAVQQVREVLTYIHEISPDLLSNPLSFVDTVRLVLTQTSHLTIPMPHEPMAMELLGWLDLAMDDAEVVIVTGMNDGHVPAFQTSDIFLPDTMRQKLKIEDNSRRYARDAYALSCLLATRQYDPQRVQLIGSRRSVEGDPLLPSRLFFAAKDSVIAERVKRFFAEQHHLSPHVQIVREETKPNHLFDIPKIPPHAGEEIKVMRVTEFAEYKKCPYRYYLKYRYKLHTQNDNEAELNAAAFGSLIHGVLDVFGKTKELKNSTSAERIRDFLVQVLHKIVHEQYGEHPRPVVAIQAERAVKRLEVFADWQAQWATEYEILDTELQFSEDCFSLDVDDKTMGLRGRIDRIDRHKKTKELAIWDYKTKDETPDKKHRNSKGEWFDFQLPLYYHLLSRHAEYSDLLQKNFCLGYILLPPDGTKGGKKVTDWDRPTILSGIDGARDIVRRIWNNEFEKIDPPPKYSEDFAAICNDF